MLNIKIKTDNINCPRWKMDIKKYNMLTWNEMKMLEEIAMTLEKYNEIMDEEREERETLPFN